VTRRGWVLLPILGTAVLGSAANVTSGLTGAPYTIDSKTSRLTIETETTGLSSMFGHDHRFDVRDFSGVLTMRAGAPASAVLELTVRAGAVTLMENVDDDTRQEIAAALRDAVLETARYPEVAFRSRRVSATLNADGSFDVTLRGDLSLHGVRRSIVVPAHVVPTRDGLRATGALSLRQSAFKIRPYTFANGTVSVRNAVTVSFDIVARR